MSEENKCEVDVEQIMQSIRRDIQMAEDKDIDGLPAFEDIPLREGGLPAWSDDGVSMDEFYRALTRMSKTCNIPYYGEMGPRGLKTFIKRIVRKLSKCVVMPILDKQNELNASFVCGHYAFRFFSEEAREKQEEYDRKLEEMKNGIKRLEEAAQRMEETTRRLGESEQRLNERVERLERRIASLDKQSDAFGGSAAKESSGDTCKVQDTAKSN